MFRRLTRFGDLSVVPHKIENEFIGYRPRPVKPLIYFSKTQKCWKVAHMNRAGNEWRAYYVAFNFCHKLNVRLMEIKNAE